MNEKVYSIDEITAILLPIIIKYKADKAILFGSYAKNMAGPESDIDVMVIGYIQDNDITREMVNDNETVQWTLTTP